MRDRKLAFPAIYTEMDNALTGLGKMGNIE